MTRELTIIDNNLMEEFLSILSVGLLECIKKEVIDPFRAEQWLFSPVIAYSSKLKEYSDSFRYALDFASETYAAIKCNNFEKSIDENLGMFFKIIEMIPKNKHEGKPLIEGII